MVKGGAVVHPVDTSYYIVRATSNVDGSLISEHLPEEFTAPDEPSQDGLAVLLDCNCEDKNWSSHVSLVPRLVEFIFGEVDIPDYLSLGCQDISHGPAHTIISVQGGSGVTWSAPDRNGL